MGSLRTLRPNDLENKELVLYNSFVSPPTDVALFYNMYIADYSLLTGLQVKLKLFDLAFIRFSGKIIKFSTKSKLKICEKLRNDSA